MHLPVLTPYGTGHLPAVNLKRIPAAYPVEIVPSTDRVVVKVETFGNHLARFSVIQQQNRICTSRNTMICALRAGAGLKFKARR
jgi:hypothetical protein